MTCTMNHEPMARRAVCRHVPRCPSATAPDWAAAHTVIARPEQGWSLLCNGVVLFDDDGGLFPDGHVAAPRGGGARPRKIAMDGLAGPGRPYGT